MRPGLVHYLLNKPPGVVTTADDPGGRTTVVELVPAEPRVFPVGRLDRDTEGLLLLTNDGELTHRLTHPSFGVEKEYLAHVEGVPARAALRALREGVELEDGTTAPARVSTPQPGLVRIIIHEGRNRQVRRMCEAVGHPVRRLVRTRIGPIADRSLLPRRVAVADRRRGPGARTRDRCVIGDPVATTPIPAEPVASRRGPRPGRRLPVTMPGCHSEPCAAPRRSTPTRASRSSSASRRCSTRSSRRTSSTTTTS
ncbi:MAG: pseudouridine synthase [Acidimicrobiia bacterium]|nr:pseudouridine synthase [Acidimicrobiia bacterium]